MAAKCYGSCNIRPPGNLHAAIGICSLFYKQKGLFFFLRNRPCQPDYQKSLFLCPAFFAILAGDARGSFFRNSIISMSALSSSFLLAGMHKLYHIYLNNL